MRAGLTLAVVSVVLFGCSTDARTLSQQGAQAIVPYEDVARGVICYVYRDYRSSAISCIPKSFLRKE